MFTGTNSRLKVSDFLVQCAEKTCCAVPQTETQMPELPVDDIFSPLVKDGLFFFFV